MRLPKGWIIGLSIWSFCLTARFDLAAEGSVAAGGGTYFVGPGIRTEFQFDSAHVQCKIGHSVMPDGTGFQMFMFSKSIDSVKIDAAARTVTIKGTMVSEVNLRFTDGTTATLTETVPFVAFAKDSGAAGADTFSLTVIYKDTPALDQFDLFGSPATFAGTVLTGNVTVK